MTIHQGISSLFFYEQRINILKEGTLQGCPNPYTKIKQDTKDKEKLYKGQGELNQYGTNFPTPKVSKKESYPPKW